MRTDLVTLAFPGIGRPCLKRSEASFFVFLDVLLQSRRWPATQTSTPVTVRNVPLLTLAAPPGPENEDGTRDCQGHQGTSASVSVGPSTVPSDALRTSSNDRVGSDPSRASGRRRDLRGFPTSHRRSRAGWHLAPGDVRTRSIVVLLPALN